MRKIFKNNVTVEQITNSMYDFELKTFTRWIEDAMTNAKTRKTSWGIALYRIKFGKITDMGDNRKYVSVNFTSDRTGARTRKNLFYVDGNYDMLARDIIRTIASDVLADLMYWTVSYSFDDSRRDYDENVSQINRVDMDNSSNKYLLNEFAGLFDEEFYKFKMNAIEKRQKIGAENWKVYNQWCKETNTFVWTEAQDVIYTMEPEDFKNMLYEHNQPLPVEERLISPVEESEIQNQDTDEVEVEDTPMLDGADEILDAIVAGDFKAGKMIADDGNVLTVTLDGNWLSDGTRKVKLAKRSTEYVARILEDFCKDDPVKTYREYMEELVTDSPEVVIGILADTMDDFNDMVADTENYGTGADFNMDWYRAYCDTVEWFYDDCDVRTVVVDRTELENDGCFEEAYTSELFEEKMNVAFDKYLTDKRKVIMDEKKVRTNIEGMFEEDGYLETPGGYNLDFEGGVVTLTEPNGEFVEICDLDEDDDTEVSMEKIIDVLKKKGILDDFVDVEEDPANKIIDLMTDFERTNIESYEGDMKTGHKCYWDDDYSFARDSVAEYLGVDADYVEKVCPLEMFAKISDGLVGRNIFSKTDDVSADMWMALRAGKKNWSFSQNGVDYSYDTDKGEIYVSKGAVNVIAKLVDDDMDSLNDTLGRLTDKVICTDGMCDKYGPDNVDTFIELWDLAFSLAEDPDEGMYGIDSGSFKPLAKAGVDMEIYDNPGYYTVDTCDDDGDYVITFDNNETRYTDCSVVENPGNPVEIFEALVELLDGYSNEAYAEHNDDVILDEIAESIKGCVEFGTDTLCYNRSDSFAYEWDLDELYGYEEEIEERAGLDKGTLKYHFTAKGYTFEW